MKEIIWAIQAGLFYLFTLLVASLPCSKSLSFGKKIGIFLFTILRKRKLIAIDDIRQALPFMRRHPNWTNSFETPEEIADATFMNLGASIVEVSRLYHGRGEEVINSIELRGRQHYEDARAKGKGLIFFTGHCGNWELVALAFSSLFNEGLSVLARRQNNPYLNRMIERMRMSYSSNVIYKQGSLKKILSALKKGGLIGILADQAVLPEEGVLIEVMGRKAWASKAPVIIAQKSGAPLLPTFIHREGKGHVITFYPEHIFSGDMSDEGIQKETQALSRYVENFIVAHPTEWYWVHRRWKRAGEHV